MSAQPLTLPIAAIIAANLDSYTVTDSNQSYVVWSFNNLKPLFQSDKLCQIRLIDFKTAKRINARECDSRLNKDVFIQ